MPTMVEFTPEMRDRLRKAYNKAVAENATSFTFDGNLYLVEFAEYLLVYPDDVLGVRS